MNYEILLWEGQLRALVLAGGFAKRMWPITLEVAKPLLEVAGKPALDYLMEKLLRIKEVDAVVITINKRFEPQFRNWLEARNYGNVELIVEEATREEEKLGAVAGIANALSKLKGQDCLIVAGDNVFDFDLNDFVKRFIELNKPLIGLYDIKSLEQARRYAVVEVDSSWRIRRMVEKPEEPWSTLVAICIYALPFKDLLLVEEYLRKGGSRDAPGRFIAWLVQQREVYGYLFSGVWFDIGDATSYTMADRFFKNQTFT